MSREATVNEAWSHNLCLAMRLTMECMGCTSPQMPFLESVVSAVIHD